MTDLTRYCSQAILQGIAHAVEVDPQRVATAPWVRLKCRFGCPGYDRSYCCPPFTPTPDETRAILDSFQRAILFHIEAPRTPERGKRIAQLYEFLVDLEGAVFKDGHHKAFVFLSGPCRLCDTCARLSGAECVSRGRARPSMEACGIDVFETARAAGLPIHTLSRREETQNHYCLMLVD